jgi:ATP-binding cassette, subfamily G (WHITE), member 2, PDR
MANGQWISAPMGDFQKDPRLEIVYENGRPSYFQEKVPQLHDLNDGDKSPSNHQASGGLDGHSSGASFGTAATPEKPEKILEEKLKQNSSMQEDLCLDDSKEIIVTELARSMSRSSTDGVRNEKGELVNPFFGSENPVLDPNSGNFNLKAWLETVMSITSRDPERYPKRVAGVAYKNLSVHGFGEPTDYQKTFGNYPFEFLSFAKRLVGREKKTRIQILRDFDGLVKSREMLVVLGKPGRQVILWKNNENIANKYSGCSTLLKTISGETGGFYIADDSYMNYQGIPQETMHKDFRGECIYQAETDVHFPQLTVGQTLDFAARARVCWINCISVNTILTLTRLPATACLVLVEMYVLRRNHLSPERHYGKHHYTDYVPRCMLNT